jgi:hypothetical protein
VIYHRYDGKDKLTLGVKGEVIPYDYTLLGWDAFSLMEQLHEILYAALMERNIYHAYVWTGHVQQVFARNHITTVGQIVNMSESKVFTLRGCGLVVRKEVYNVFQNTIGITLPAWEPKRWYAKYRNYDFGDE